MKNTTKLKVAITSDHAGFELKQKIRHNLETLGFGILDLGPNNSEPVDYPDYGKAIANKIIQGDVDRGIALCGTGIGISISANRFQGVRAALCHDEKTAEQARKHNDANILAIGARHINIEDAIKCVNTFLKTDFEGERHIKRIEKLDNKHLPESSINTNDTELEEALANELSRQQNTVELIASENFTSANTMYYQGSVLTNKYAEGYPGKRYYGGCEFVDVIENLAIERLKNYIHAIGQTCNQIGSQANQAVYLALLSPGDSILGMSLSAGGHLTHGASPNQSGKYFHSITYGVREEDGIIDYDEVRKLAKKNKPKLIIAGASAYSSKIDFKLFREIADEINAYLLVDMAHYSGLIASGCYPDPLPFADVCTSTTHKTLRGPRGGIILSNNLDLGKKIDKAVFPGMQGGPLMHVIAAKAAAFKEANSDSFRNYSRQTVNNAKALCNRLIKNGFKIVSGGTDCHMILVDLTSKNVTGKAAEESLDRSGITCNKNSIPFDKKSPFVTSGIRVGTAAGTTRGFKETQFEFIADCISKVINGLSSEDEEHTYKIESSVLSDIKKLCQNFPIYK